MHHPPISLKSKVSEALPQTRYQLFSMARQLFGARSSPEIDIVNCALLYLFLGLLGAMRSFFFDQNVISGTELVEWYAGELVIVIIIYECLGNGDIIIWYVFLAILDAICQSIFAPISMLVFYTVVLAYAPAMFIVGCLPGWFAAISYLLVTAALPVVVFYVEPVDSDIGVVPYVVAAVFALLWLLSIVGNRRS